MSQIQVRFVNSTSSLPPILLPIELKRRGLSQVINHLLSTNIPYDFLINGEYLIGSLAQWTADHGISRETILEIEFKPSVQVSESDSIDCNDWITCIKRGKHGLLVASMDGQVSLLKGGNLKPLIKDSHGVFTVLQQDDIIVTGGMSHHLHGWNEKGESQWLGVGHTDIVTSLDVLGDTMISGSNDSTIKLWNLPENAKRGLKLHALGTGTSHTQPVTCVKITQDQIFSSSLDRTIRIWDQETLTDYKTFNSDSGVLGFTISNDLILSCHTDPWIRLWDLRSKEGSVVKLKFNSHAAWSSAVAWSPLDPHQFASVGYDGQLRVWDMRSSLPIYSLQVSLDKLLTITWEKDAIYAGGEDKKIKVHQVKSE